MDAVHRPAVGLLAVLAWAAAGCGGGHDAAQSTAPAGAARRAPAAKAAVAPHLRIVARRRLPAPVQLPALARLSDGTVLAIGGLDAADQSVDAIVRLAPGAPRRMGRLAQPAHDIGAAGIGARAYAFGGGTAAGPLADVRGVSANGAVRAVGRLPVAMSDTGAAAIGDTAYVIGGFTTGTPLRSVLAFRPGGAVRDVATLPHPLRYAAVAALGGRLLVAGGTDGVHGRREILAVDPARHRVRVVARLPQPLSHAAGAAVSGRFYVLGGRGDAPGTPARGDLGRRSGARERAPSWAAAGGALRRRSGVHGRRRRCSPGASMLPASCMTSCGRSPHDDPARGYRQSWWRPSHSPAAQWPDAVAAAARRTPRRRARRRPAAAPHPAPPRSRRGPVVYLRRSRTRTSTPRIGRAGSPRRSGATRRGSTCPTASRTPST